MSNPTHDNGRSQIFKPWHDYRVPSELPEGVTVCDVYCKAQAPWILQQVLQLERMLDNVHHHAPDKESAQAWREFTDDHAGYLAMLKRDLEVMAMTSEEFDAAAEGNERRVRRLQARSFEDE